MIRSDFFPPLFPLFIKQWIWSLTDSCKSTTIHILLFFFFFSLAPLNWLLYDGLFSYNNRLKRRVLVWHLSIAFSLNLFPFAQANLLHLRRDGRICIDILKPLTIGSCNYKRQPFPLQPHQRLRQIPLEHKSFLNIVSPLATAYSIHIYCGNIARTLASLAIFHRYSIARYARIHFRTTSALTTTSTKSSMTPPIASLVYRGYYVYQPSDTVAILILCLTNWK